MPTSKKPAKNVPEDWEHMLWFFAAYKHGIYESHIKGIDELESEIGAINPELHSNIRDYIELLKNKRALADKPDTDSKKKLATREYYRVFDKLREYIRSMD
jgi:hypothetical protein